MYEQSFVFRAPGSPNELKALFDLRAKVYREVHDYNVQVDCYDARSLHYGLFRSDDGIPVGTIRLTMDVDGPLKRHVLAIADGCAEEVAATPALPFPLLEYHPDAQVVSEFYARHKVRKEAVVEIGRLSLDASVRSLSVATFMTACTFAAVIVHNVKEALICCSPHQVPFYSRFGAERLAGTSDAMAKTVGHVFSVIHASPERISDRQRERVFATAEEYRQRGEVLLGSAGEGQIIRRRNAA